VCLAADGSTLKVLPLPPCCVSRAEPGGKLGGLAQHDCAVGHGGRPACWLMPCRLRPLPPVKSAATTLAMREAAGSTTSMALECRPDAWLPAEKPELLASTAVPRAAEGVSCTSQICCSEPGVTPTYGTSEGQGLASAAISQGSTASAMADTDLLALTGSSVGLATWDHMPSPLTGAPAAGVPDVTCMLNTAQFMRHSCSSTQLAVSAAPAPNVGECLIREAAALGTASPRASGWPTHCSQPTANAWRWGPRRGVPATGIRL